MPAWEHGLFGLFADFYGLLRTLFGLDWYLRRYARVCVRKGELLLKSGLKQEKLSVRLHYFLDEFKFFTRVEGGIGGPNSPYGALGSPGKSSRNLFYQINFNPRVCFYDYFFTQLYGLSYVKHILNGVKKFKRFNRNKTRQFFTCIAKLLTLWLVCELLKRWKIEGGETQCWHFQLPTAGWRKTFHVRRQNRVVAQMPRYTGVLTADFK